MLTPVAWRGDHAVLVDQTRLPGEVVELVVRTPEAMVDAIRRLAVRGAPAIGVAGAYAVALAARRAERDGGGADRVHADASRVAAARPTAVNLAWAVERALGALPGGADAVLAVAVAVDAENRAASRALAERGAELVGGWCPGPVRVLTHCNTGPLAVGGWGTALGIVLVLHERGRLGLVYADETRPLLQGARLTAYELAEAGIEHRVVVDGAGPSVLARGLADVVILGADRIAANGDVANKVGTYPLALAAHRAGIPFVVAAPESTLDPATPHGGAIEIEERDEAEVLGWAGVRTAPAASRAWNPAFDVTPHDLVTAIVTEARVIDPRAGRIGPPA